jgi:hypothetical protein
VSRLSLALLTVSFVVGGALMAFNPAPVGFRRSASLPYVGWFLMLGAVYVAIKIARPDAPPASGKPSRHDSGQEVSVRKSIRLVLSLPVMALCAVGTLWWGISSGLLSVLGMGVAITGMVIVASPFALQQLRWLLSRRKRRSNWAD